MMDKINEILEKKVRPALLLHSGDIELLSYEDGVVRVRLLGATRYPPFLLAAV